MPAFEVPANLRDWIEHHDPPGSPGRAWLADLAVQVGRVAELWSLQPGRPYQPGGVTAWVAPARGGRGRPVVLKIVRPDADPGKDEGLHEADGLRAWAGDGAVRLLDAAVVGSGRALLLEKCDPGTSLADAMPRAEQHRVVAGLLRRLWIEPPTGHPFRSLASMCAWWADSFDARFEAASEAASGAGFDARVEPALTVGGPPGRVGPLDPAGLLDRGMARDGIQMLRELPLDAPSEVVLCTDLHAGNILAAQREPWLVIDPKPYVGDRTYDPLQHMLNCPDQLAADARGFVRRIAALLDLDPDRLRDWLFARCVQESVGRPALVAAARSLAR